MFSRQVWIGLLLGLGLVGCASRPPSASDAARADGARAADAAPAVGDTAALQADEPVMHDLLPDADRDAGGTTPPDLAADQGGSDTALPDLAADRRAGDAAPPDLATDRSAGDATPPDFAANPEAASTPADAAEPKPTGDASTDGACVGWTTLERLSPAQAADLLATSDPIVINVHVPYEGDIPGTDVDIPYNDVDAIEAYLGYDHCADLLLVCKSGSMSQSAGKELIRRGYQRVRDINGGMDAWVKAGYPLLLDGGT